MKTRPRALAALCALAMFLLALSGKGRAEDALQAFGADPHQVTMSGFSSGAFFTAQFHVAYSSTLAGAGIIAGGPFACAEGHPEWAKFRCMLTVEGAPDPRHLLDVAHQAEAAGQIDDVSNLAHARVYIFASGKDPVVTFPVVQSIAAFYRLAGTPEANITVGTNGLNGHAFMTQGYGNPCGITALPFIGKCGVDQAGQVLEALYGPLSAPAPSAVADDAAATGRLIAFNQAEFLASPRDHSLDDRGYLYVPKACDAAESKCRLHVAMHGCLQGRESIGDQYYTRTGYNRWADANGILILYPQAVKTLRNLGGCWDWFGYDGPDYYTKKGTQMAAVKAMIDRILAPAVR